MYFFIQVSGIGDEEPVYVIESHLAVDVTLRLLIHCSPGTVQVLCTCYYEDMTWYVEATHKVRHKISDWIDPAQFLRTNSAPPDPAKWSLLSYEDMVTLIAAWRDSAKYNDRDNKDGEFFRNRVSAVERTLEEKWPQQKKSAGESTGSSKGPSTVASTASRRKRTRPRKTKS